MAQSTFRVCGFFQLCNPARIESPRRNDPSASTYHYQYNTAVQCRDNTGLPAKLRFFCRPGDSAVAHGTVCFVDAKLYVPPNVPSDNNFAFLEGVLQAAVPGNPDDKNYQNQVPDISFAITHGLGVVVDGTMDSVAGEKQFRVEVRPWVRDDNRPCSVMYVFSTFTALFPHCFIRCFMRGSRWKNTRVPQTRSAVLFDGVCEHVRPDGTLEITVDEVQNASNTTTAFHASLASHPTDSPPAKRQRFDALAFVPYVLLCSAAIYHSRFVRSSSIAESPPSPSSTSQHTQTAASPVSSRTTRSTSPTVAQLHSHGHSTRAADKHKIE